MVVLYSYNLAPTRVRVYGDENIITEVMVHIYNRGTRAEEFWKRVPPPSPHRRQHTIPSPYIVCARVSDVAAATTSVNRDYPLLYTRDPTQARQSRFNSNRFLSCLLALNDKILPLPRRRRCPVTVLFFFLQQAVRFRPAVSKQTVILLHNII